MRKTGKVAKKILNLKESVKKFVNLRNTQISGEFEKNMTDSGISAKKNHLIFVIV